MDPLEHRVARSTPDDKTFNTLDVQLAPTFAVLELLDDRDSQYFRRFLKKRRWKEVTPDAPRKKKTYKDKRPTEDEVNTYADIEPDWFYISGHYARTTQTTQAKPKIALTALPAGFFNEPFHLKEWVSVWGKTSSNSFFLQCETQVAADSAAFKKAMQKYSRRSPYGPAGSASDTANRDAAIDDWVGVWRNPAAERKVGPAKAPAARGLLCDNIWPDVKLVLLVGCNTLTWHKTGFLDAFPAALVLGYIDKNPANGTPHIVAFLKNAFKGITDPADPKLSDHVHLAKAWMDVFHKQRLTKSYRMAYMKPDGAVFAVGKAGEEYKTIKVGADSEVISRVTSPEGYEYTHQLHSYGWYA